MAERGAIQTNKMISYGSKLIEKNISWMPITVHSPFGLVKPVFNIRLLRIPTATKYFIGAKSFQEPQRG